MNAVARAVPDNEAAVGSDEEVALSDAALDALVRRSVRLHRSEIEHDAVGCIACVELR